MARTRVQRADARLPGIPDDLMLVPSAGIDTTAAQRHRIPDDLMLVPSAGIGRTATRAPRAVGNERLKVTLDGRTLDRVRDMARRTGTSESAVLADLVRAGIAASESHPTAVDVIRADPGILATIGTAATLPAVCRHGCTVARGGTCAHGRHDVAHALLHGAER
ncbi:MAG: hypothetical protein KGS10_14495 [Chloroflexi bacterium]|nr:hypothetical protein [Chloroflexota bacterium]